MTVDFTPKLEKQIACVEREIAMRKRVYPRLIESGRMKPGTASREIELMNAVLASLRGMLAPKEGAP